MVKHVAQSDSVPGGADIPWPRPVSDREWVDPQGTTWRMRGSALEAKAARRLMRRPDVRVLHAYDLEAVEVHGTAREELLDRVVRFLRGEGDPYQDFELGDFRDEDRRVLLVVQESC